MSIVGYKITGYRNNGEPVIRDKDNNPWMIFSCDEENLEAGYILPKMLFSGYLKQDGEHSEEERIRTLYIYQVNDDGTEDIVKELLNI